jgi:predicted membrane protein
VEQATGTSRLDLASLNLDSLKVSKATGATTLDLSGNHPSLKSVSVDNSTGTLDVKLNGSYTALDVLKIDAATGDISIDMSGTWQCSLDAKIKTATGAITLRLPKDVGVEVSVKAAISKVNAHGLHRDGSVWRNAAFGTAQHSVRIRINSSVANVTLKVDD